MKAILEFDAPESCAECGLHDTIYDPFVYNSYKVFCKPADEIIVKSPEIETVRNHLRNVRAHFCPLKIVLDEADSAAASRWNVAMPQHVLFKPIIGNIVELVDIEWRVLAVENGKALIISEKILEQRPYNNSFENITWERCTLRKYLNGEFYNKLGMAEIADTRNSNLDNPWFGTPGGYTTTDKIFLLSLNEVYRYFGDSTANLRKKGSTGSDYWIDDGNNKKRIAKDESGGASWWWLRSPGRFDGYAAGVYADGGLDVGGRFVDSEGGVRPALWLNL